MMILVKLYGKFRTKYFSEKEIIVQNNSTVSDVLLAVGIGNNERGALILNGKVAKQSDQVKDGDTLAVVPFIAAG